MDNTVKPKPESNKPFRVRSALHTNEYLIKSTNESTDIKESDSVIQFREEILYERCMICNAQALRLADALERGR